MERIPTNEKVAAIDLNRYLEFTASLNSIDGVVVDDVPHAFYMWLMTAYPVFQDIDGTSLLALYERNVVNGDMAHEDFYAYCLNHDFPSPYPRSEHDALLYEQFDSFLQVQQVEKRQKYEEWAAQWGIDTSPGASTIFLDTDGNRYRVLTDFEEYGEIVE